MDELISKLKSAGLVDEIGNIVLERYSGGYQAVDQSTFRTMFGEAVETARSEDEGDIYSALVSADGGRGYSRFFDAWREEGII